MRRKQFFFENKNQKTFGPFPRALPQRALQTVKISRFFFSKGNCFRLALIP